MKTTTKESNYTLQEENLLYTSNGDVNQAIYSKLNKIIHKFASLYASRNPTTTVEDLEQDAWVKIFETIKNKPEDRFKDIRYLVIVAKNEIIGKCMDISKEQSHIDDYATCLLSSSDIQTSNGRNNVNVEKSKLEYELQSHRLQEDDATILRIVLEDIIENIDTKGKNIDSYKQVLTKLSKREQQSFLTKVKMMIVIRYIKDFNGSSPKLRKIYDDYYNTLNIERQFILDKMDKFTNNACFKAMGMRATDNPTKYIRSGVKEILISLMDD